ncbi:MAG: hypothetical protein N3A61_05340 [Ignavibacteria bacterium]|nr:hypothetical protein [Ignavibacteria bacterium]
MNNIGKVYFIIISFTLSLSSFDCWSAKEPINLSDLKSEIENYFLDTTKYLAEVKKVCENVKKFISSNLDTKKKNAVIFDVDETALLNLEYIKEHDYGYTMESWENFLDEAKSIANKPVLELYQWIRKQPSISIFFITGRFPSKKGIKPEPTELNLIKEGFIGYDSLFMKPREEKISTGDYKLKIRKLLKEAGYHIIANIGDQESDFRGGYSERNFKLPNPLYRID